VQDFKKTRAQVATGLAVARDEALVKVGKAAEARLMARGTNGHRGKAGKLAIAAALAGGTVAVGALAVRALARKGAAQPEVAAAT
jgi:hypothetical protein